MPPRLAAALFLALAASQGPRRCAPPQGYVFLGVDEGGFFFSHLISILVRGSSAADTKCNIVALASPDQNEGVMKNRDDTGGGNTNEFKAGIYLQRHCNPHTVTSPPPQGKAAGQNEQSKRSLLLTQEVG